MNRPVDIGEVVRGLAARAPELAAIVFPEGRREGHEYYVGSLYGEPGRSLALRLTGAKAGVWCDFATGESGDALDLVAAVHFGGDKKQAFRWALSWLGLDGRDPGAFTKTRRALARPADAAAPEREAAGKRRAAMARWLEAAPELRHGAVDHYLRGRGIDLARLGRAPRAIRCHPGLSNPENDVLYPAMVTAITGPDGQIAGVHRTWLQRQPDGRVFKAPLKYPKRTLGPYKGAAIRLWRGAGGKSLKKAEAGSSVVLCEGIEDGLSIALACPELRILTAISLYNIGNVILPPEIEEVVIYADNDPDAGEQKALERAIQSFINQGRRVRVARSPVGKDANDLWRAELARRRREKEPA